MRHLKRINVVIRENGGGLTTHLRILLDVLGNAGFRLTVNGHPPVPRALPWVGTAVRRNLFRRVLKRRLYDVNLFVEHVEPAYLPQAKMNFLLPHPEWFRDDQHAFLPYIDRVLCLTEDGVHAFSTLGAPTQLVGFTSPDRWDREVPKGGSFLHVAGRSEQKGTRAVFDVWLRHPEWPRLVVVQREVTTSGAKIEAVRAPNIDHILHRLDDAELRYYQSSAPVVLCPSEAEGFGHCIVEAMSCGSLTLTTDAPPMNELVSPERGVLVRYTHREPQRLGTVYHVDVDDLEAKIERVVQMDPDERGELGSRARAWFEENDRRFRRRFVQALRDACG
jgi:glycosyltransferase involved in cell wall biosynthesis